MGISGSLSDSPMTKQAAIGLKPFHGLAAYFVTQNEPMRPRRRCARRRTPVQAKQRESATTYCKHFDDRATKTPDVRFPESGETYKAQTDENYCFESAEMKLTVHIPLE